MTPSGLPPKVVAIWRSKPADQMAIARLLRLLFEQPATSAPEEKVGGGRARAS
jgi:hypothetical protein